MRKLFDAIYRKEYLEMDFDVPIDLVVDRLQKEVGRTFFSALSSQRMVGYVSKERICIRRVIPLFQNSFSPILFGSLTCKNGKTNLNGVLRMHRYTQLFMSLWFGFIVVWLALVSVLAVVIPSEAWMFPLIGILFFGAGVGILFIGKWFSRNDKEWIENNITYAICKNS